MQTTGASNFNLRISKPADLLAPALVAWDEAVFAPHARAVHDLS